MLGPPYELINAFTPKGWSLEELKSIFSSFGVLYGDGIKVSTNPKKNSHFKVLFTTTKGVLDAYKALNGARCAVFDPTLRWNLTYSKETRLKLIASGLLNESAQKRWVAPIRMPPGPSTQLLHKSCSKTVEKGEKTRGNEEKKIMRKQEALNAFKQLEKIKKTSLHSFTLDLKVKNKDTTHTTDSHATCGFSLKEPQQIKPPFSEKIKSQQKETSSEQRTKVDPSLPSPIILDLPCSVVKDVTLTKRECSKTGENATVLTTFQSPGQNEISQQVSCADGRHGFSTLNKKSGELLITPDKTITPSVNGQASCIHLMEANKKELLLTDTQTKPYVTPELKQKNSALFKMMCTNESVNHSNCVARSTSVNKQNEMTGRKLSIISLLKTQETCSSDKRSDEEKHLCLNPVSSNAMTEHMIYTKQTISASSSSIQMIKTPQLYHILIEPCIALDSWCHPFVNPSCFFPPILPYPFKADNSVDTT